MQSFFVHFILLGTLIFSTLNAMESGEEHKKKYDPHDLQLKSISPKVTIIPESFYVWDHICRNTSESYYYSENSGVFNEKILEKVRNNQLLSSGEQIFVEEFYEKVNKGHKIAQIAASNKRNIKKKR